MEQADIFKLTMTVDEARKQIDQLPEESGARQLPENFACRTLCEKLTPAQAQAVLVLAWNEMLGKTRISCPGYEPWAD